MLKPLRKLGIEGNFLYLQNVYSCHHTFFFLINLFIYLFIYLFYFWLHWVFVAVCRLSLVAASRDYSLLHCAGFSLQWLLLLQSTGSRHTGFSSCNMWAQ